jgi:hypothetical protein
VLCNVGFSLGCCVPRCRWLCILEQSPDIVAGLTVKYKRALFGGLSSCTPYRVVTASPEEGCQLLRTPLPTGESEYDTNIAVMAERGLCKFEDKATVAGLAGGTAVFVSNNKEEPTVGWQLS